MDDQSSVIEIAGIILCLIFSALFSGSETALTSISTTRARFLIQESYEKWGPLKKWLNSKRQLLTTLLVGNNVVNILCSILAYRLAYRYVPNWAEAISVFGLTLVILIFAEISPKGLALNHSEKIAVPALRFVWFMDKILYPISRPLSRLPLLLFSVNVSEDGEPMPTEDEIKYHIKRGLDKAIFDDSNQAELLMASIEFSITMVKEIMIPRTEMSGLEENSTLEEALCTVLESGHSRLPIYKDNPDHIVGILHAKDILSYLQKNNVSKEFKVYSIMRKDVFFAPETQKISLLLTDMRRRSSHIAIVVDEFGGTAGIITLEDIIEELVGEIHDEHDVDEPEVREVEDNRWVVDAMMTIPDFENETGVILPESENYESIGGFVVHHLGRIPKRGKTLNTAGLQITVIDSDLRHIKLLEIRKDPPFLMKLRIVHLMVHCHDEIFRTIDRLSQARRNIAILCRRRVGFALEIAQKRHRLIVAGDRFRPPFI
jgi:putative hemolysin